jgi:DNA gyrase/topoisomerase IV subunit A
MKLKWFSHILSDRMKIELSVFKLLYQAEQMEKNKEDLMKTIGERMLELKEHSEKSILKDRIIADAMNEIEKINQEIEEIKKQASEISSTQG